MKKIGWLFLALLFSLALISGCGAQPEDEVVANKLRDVLGAGLEGMSAEDLDSLESGDMDSLAAPADPAPLKRLAGEGAALIAPAVPPAPPWWLYLHPGRLMSRANARRMIEAPAQLIFYILAHPGSVPNCALPDSNTCPLDYSNGSDTCEVHFDFGAVCDVTFQVTDYDGSTVNVTLRLSGALDHAEAVTQASSGPLVRDGKWTWTDTATAFAVTDPLSLQAIIYSGKLTRTSDGTAAALPYDWKHVWQSKAADNPLTITNALGQKLRANGTRSVSVLPGSSLEAADLTHIALIPLAGNSLRVTRDFVRGLYLDPVGGATAVTTVNSTVTLHLSRDWVWKRTGTATIHRLNLISVKINGLEELTRPDGKKIKLRLTDVIVSLGQIGPVSGKAVVKFPSGLAYALVFHDGCAVSWTDNQGESGNFDYCRYDDFKE